MHNCAVPDGAEQTGPAAAKRHACALAIVGTVIQIGIWVFSMSLFRAAYRLRDEKLAAGVDATTANGEMYGSLIGTFVYVGGMGLLGLILSWVAAGSGRYRARWFFWCSLALAILYLPFVPGGTLLSLGFITYLIVKRREFLA